jgi:hypothetical protein
MAILFPHESWRGQTVTEKGPRRMEKLGYSYINHPCSDSYAEMSNSRKRSQFVDKREVPEPGRDKLGIGD